MAGPDRQLARSSTMADLPNPAARSAFAAPQSSRAVIRFGDRVSMEAEVRVTPLGLLAIGGLVSAILLSIPPIVRAAAEVRRRRDAPP